MIDLLGYRMKNSYENRTRFYLPIRTYVIIRLDGKSFSKLTRKLIKPFDKTFSNAMEYTAIELCKQIQGCKFAYTQSDEISLLITDFDTIGTQAWFDYNISKMLSISASIATAEFNFKIGNHVNKLANFDSRVFTIPDRTEVENYFIFRQKDCIRNSVSMTAQQFFSHKELNKKNTLELKELLISKDQNIENYPSEFRKGILVYKDSVTINNTIRNKWISKTSFNFTEERFLFNNLIPFYNDSN